MCKCRQQLLCLAMLEAKIELISVDDYSFYLIFWSIFTKLAHLTCIQIHQVVKMFVFQIINPKLGRNILIFGFPCIC